MRQPEELPRNPPDRSTPTPEDIKRLDDLQCDSFGYFLYEVNEKNGLVADKTREHWPASIAATGLALACYPVGVQRKLMSWEAACQRTLNTVRFFSNSPQGSEPGATGYRGFYYHYLDMNTGQRVFDCELSTVDTAYLIAGMLVAAAYFDGDTEEEAEIRQTTDRLYRRVEWDWARGNGAALCHGWQPGAGFLPYRWEGYDESLLLYMLALGSPTHPIAKESYLASVNRFAWKKIYGREFVFAGPLFIHQFPHMFVDFREIQDDYMRERGMDYFENSRIATLIQQEYAIRNPKEYAQYNAYSWGITASDGPGPATIKLDGIERVFYDYIARGAPYGPDDGTLAPWAVVASLPFAPDIVLPTIERFTQLKLKENKYGYKATFNPTYPDQSRNEYGWVSPYHFGINQAPIVLMIENYRTEMLWNLVKKCSYLRDGLRKASFRGGWLEE